MADIVELFGEEKFNVDYVLGDDGKVIAVSHPDWPFRIQRKGENIAFVCEETDEPFGELNGDLFNTVVMCWLLIDDPRLIDTTANQ